MSKRILFLSNHFITLYSFRKELIKLLVESGHEVYLSLPQDDDNSYFVSLGCKIIETPIDRRGVNPINDIRLLFFYKKILKDISPDIVFSYTIKPNIYGSMVCNNKYKQICNITGTGATFLKENILSKICKFLYRISVRKAYKVFFQNSGDLEFFQKNGMIGDNYELIPGSGCNIDEHLYHKMPDDKIVRFIFVGRVMELKGIDDYLEAAKKIKSQYDNVEFLIAGWNEEEKYKKTVSEYCESGIVKYIGFRDDISTWLVATHCTVLPSRGGEGVPNVMLETSATGRACIGSRINGTVDAIENGVTGYLFEAGNVGELTEAIESFIELTYEEKNEMGLKGRRLVEQKFDRKLVIAKYMSEISD